MVSKNAYPSDPEAIAERIGQLVSVGLSRCGICYGADADDRPEDGHVWLGDGATGAAVIDTDARPLVNYHADNVCSHHADHPDVVRENYPDADLLIPIYLTSDGTDRRNRYAYHAEADGATEL